MSALFAQNPLGRMAPLAAMIAAGAVIAATALMKDRGPTVVSSPVAETRLLRFADAPGGAVLVETAEGAVIATYGSGEGSFLRGILRSFARDRRGAEVAAQVPFELTRHADGRTSLRDTATGQVVVLDAFGTTNAAMFASLLREGKQK
jgi:putative photosynthetic complex assembly protein